MKKFIINLGLFLCLVAMAGCAAGSTPTQPPDLSTPPEQNPPVATPGSGSGTICTAEYKPVCGYVPVQCITAPCYPVPQTFSNDCEATAGKAVATTPGECASNLKSDDPRVVAPLPNETVVSPIMVTGSAPGTWYFEGVFSVDIVDDKDKVLGTAVLTATTDWMTTDFVPFTGTLTFTKPAGVATGALIFKNDNPSGLPENARSFRVPVTF